MPRPRTRLGIVAYHTSPTWDPRAVEPQACRIWPATPGWEICCHPVDPGSFAQGSGNEILHSACLKASPGFLATVRNGIFCVNSFSPTPFQWQKYENNILQIPPLALKRFSPTAI